VVPTIAVIIPGLIYWCMSDSDRLGRFLKTKVRGAGRQFEEAKQAFAKARREAASDGSGPPVKLVCRRYAEKRSVRLDSAGRPACFESGHGDCEGCVEDIKAGCIETWE